MSAAVVRQVVYVVGVVMQIAGLGAAGLQVSLTASRHGLVPWWRRAGSRLSQELSIVTAGIRHDTARLPWLRRTPGEPTIVELSGTVPLVFGASSATIEVFSGPIILTGDPTADLAAVVARANELTEMSNASRHAGHMQDRKLAELERAARNDLPALEQTLRQAIDMRLREEATAPLRPTMAGLTLAAAGLILSSLAAGFPSQN